MFAPLTDKVKQKSASSRTLTHGMKRLKNQKRSTVPPELRAFLHATRCAVTGAPGRGSPLRSAVVELRHMTGCLQHPCGAALSASWRRELSLSASSLLQDETTLIVARPAEKSRDAAMKFFLHFSSFGCRNSEKACWCGIPDWNTGCDSRRTYSSGRRPEPSAQTRPR